MQDLSTPPKPIKLLNLISFVCTFLLSWQAVFRIPDGAMVVFFRFFSLFLLKLGNITGSEDLQKIHELFPNSLNHARRMQGMNCDDFRKLVVCQKCYSTYQYKDCIGTGAISNCTFFRFPRPPKANENEKTLSLTVVENCQDCHWQANLSTI